MAKYSVLQTFYASDVWRNFRLMIINLRGLRCEHCGEWVAVASELTIHHIIELTPDNVHDATVALNPDNVMVVHHACHNKIHKRNQTKTKQAVYIVYGPPLSGKSSFVRENMEPGDIVVDYDALFQSISMQPVYNKPNNLLPNVRALHNLLIDNIKTRYGKWETAWIIGGYADKYKREKLADDLGAELVFMDATEAECLARLKKDPERSKREAEWTGYIKKWFQDHTE